MIKYKTYKRAQSLDEAYELMQKKSSRLLGGMIWLNLGNTKVGTAIDLQDLALDYITETVDAFEIGAYTSLRALETDQKLNAAFGGAFRAALCDIEGVQLRNMATVGGTVALRAGFSDLCTLLLAMDAKIALFKKGTVPMDEYLRQSRQEKDIVTKIIVPKSSGNAVYEALRNSKTDLPVLNCAAVRTAGGLRIAVGARPGIARLTAISFSSGDASAKSPQSDISISESETLEFAKSLAASYDYQSNIRASAEYRQMLAETLIARALAKLFFVKEAK